MYRKQNREKQKDLRMACLEDLVPKDHLLQKIEGAMDFDFIYDEVKGLYSALDWGKPGIDPVSLFIWILCRTLVPPAEGVRFSLVSDNKCNVVE